MNIKVLEGQTLTNVKQFGDEKIVFEVGDTSYRMMHHQECCENVYIEDVNGDLMDLVGTPILVAEERTELNSGGWESSTWTFYTIRTIRGSVDIRWNGESNGYYSEGVDFEEIDPVTGMSTQFSHTTE